MPNGARVLPDTLSAEEQRVLAAFYGGRLPAGKLSAALAVARGGVEPERPAAPVALHEQPTQAVPALQFAA